MGDGEGKGADGSRLNITHMNCGTILFFSRIMLAIAGLLASTGASATHLRAGEITAKAVSCTGLTYQITITVYTDTSSPIRFSNGASGILDFGDGTIINPPQIESMPVP